LGWPASTVGLAGILSTEVLLVASMGHYLPLGSVSHAQLPRPLVLSIAHRDSWRNMCSVAASYSAAVHRPALSSNRICSGQGFVSAAPLPHRSPLALQAVAGARPAATEPPPLEPPAPAPLAAQVDRPKPALEVFPAMIASRLTDDNRAFIESHRCGGKTLAVAHSGRDSTLFFLGCPACCPCSRTPQPLLCLRGWIYVELSHRLSRFRSLNI
jgi:hypothetical protein